MGLLSGKRLLITGVLTDASLAFAVAERSIAEGAEVLLTGAGRGLSLTKRTARKLEKQPEVLEFDVTSPEQAKDLNIWLENLEQSTQIIGSIEGRSNYLNNEIDALRPLKRGAFSKENIKKEKVLDVDDFYFAIPSQEDQLLANNVSKFSDIVAKSDLETMSDIKYSNLEIKDNKKSLEVIRDKVLQLISDANLNYLSKETLEISHHYGIDNFYEYGSSLITIINKLYGKKLLIMLPGQENPTHFHKKKEESFIILHGELIVNLENEEHILNPGDILHIPLTHNHSFKTKNGSVFEEISTTHFTDDSYYSDKKIMDNKNRKSYIPLR